MDVKLKELVSLSASVTAHCFPCFDYHLEQARKLGICEEEIQESIRAGYMVMNGAGQKIWEKIKDTLPGFSIQKNENCSNNQRINASLCFYRSFLAHVIHRSMEKIENWGLSSIYAISKR